MPKIKKHKVDVQKAECVDYAKNPNNLKLVSLSHPSTGVFHLRVPSTPPANAALLRLILPQVRRHAVELLDRVAAKIFNDATFEQLDLEQRTEVWECVQTYKKYDNHLLEELVLIMDGAHSIKDTILYHDSALMRSYASKIFCYNSYLSMSIAERQLLKEFINKTKGTQVQWKSPANAELKKAFICSKDQVPVLKLPHKRVYQVEKSLKARCFTDDITRYNYLLRRHASMLYNIPYPGLASPAKLIVERQVQAEYKALIIKETGREPCTLDQAAYLVYLIPYLMLSPFAQRCVERFRRLMLEKQWNHLILLERKPVLADAVYTVPFYGMEEQDTWFLLNFSMNQAMLSPVELRSVNAFPTDFPRRFQRMYDLRAVDPTSSYKNYLQTLFLEDCLTSTILHNPNAKNVEPAQIVTHFVEAFDLSIEEFNTGTAQGSINAKISQVEAKPEPRHALVPIELLEIVDEDSTVTQDYLDVIDVSKMDTDKTEKDSLDQTEDSQDLVKEGSSEGATKCSPPLILTRFHQLCYLDLVAKINNHFKESGVAASCKFKIVNSSHLDKEELLLTFIDSLPNCIQRFYIMNYQAEGTDYVFYSRQCLDVIHAIVRKHFLLKFNGENLEFTMELNCDKSGLPKMYSICNILNESLGHMLREQQGHIDLSSFNKKFKLKIGPHEIIYPLCLPMHLQHVFSCLNSIVTKPIFSMDLSNNRIETVNLGLNRMSAHFSNLSTLDLRNNKLNLSAVNCFAAMPLKKIFLDGNLLCSIYDKEQDYITDVMNIWPDLEYLDGIKMCAPRLYGSRKHFLVSANSKPFADQFLTHYFSIFDSGRRDLLSGVYHSKASLTLTCQYLKGQSTSGNASLTFYFKQNRNIKTTSDFSKLNDLILDGATNVMEFYSSFPETRHDSTAFNVDLLGFTNDRVHLSVSGVFLEGSEMLPRFFRRVMFLVNFHGTYLIVNEMLHINNCTTEQAALVPKKIEVQPPLELYLTSNPKLTFLSDQNKLAMMKKLSDLTGMNILWSKKCLDDMQWDLRNALIYFQGFYQRSVIPSEAFL